MVKKTKLAGTFIINENYSGIEKCLTKAYREQLSTSGHIMTTTKESYR